MPFALLLPFAETPLINIHTISDLYNHYRGHVRLHGVQNMAQRRFH